MHFAPLVELDFAVCAILGESSFKNRYNKIMAFDAQSLLKSMTQRPGIYQMMDADGAVLYVGKAKNLSLIHI